MLRGEVIAVVDDTTSNGSTTDGDSRNSDTPTMLDDEAKPLHAIDAGFLQARFL